MRFVLPLIILALAAPAAAQTQTATDAKPAEAKAAKDDKVCVTKPKVGTRFKTRTCQTRAEYERQQLEERQALQRMTRVPYKAE